MRYNPAIHKRRSIRLGGYDYSQAGLYFITICVQNRELLFGEIKNGEMMLNDAGKMIWAEWEKLPQRFTNIELHEFVVMPNHFHAILEIVPTDAVGAPLVVAPVPDDDDANNDADMPIRATTRVAPTEKTPTDSENDTGTPQNKTVGNMIGAFKSITTVEYIRGVKNLDWHPFDSKLWQRDYYEHIIRNAQAYKNISEYIVDNPARWNGDKFHSN